MLKLHPDSIGAEVRAALAEDRPVVALESTIIAHGMPHPANLETARAVENIVRAGGAVPATIAILNGMIRVGLNDDELTLLATAQDVLKATERDIPLACAKGRHAATTAGASMAIAAGAGIRVFVTGGIGGVGAEAGPRMDISSDLLALADHPVITVCSGSKAFMDIPATLEYLETLRVAVMGYQTDEFPMFYSRSSGCKVDWRADEPRDIAAVYFAQRDLGMAGGILVGVPIPVEAEMPAERARVAIDLALTEAKRRGLSGKAVTPFLLAAIKAATDGESLSANIALIENNARVGTAVAVAVHNFRR